MPRSFDTLPTLDIKQLRRAGLFQKRGDAVTVRHKGTFVVIWCRDVNELLVNYDVDGDQQLHIVNCCFVTNNIGGRPYFRCPVTNKRVEKLYLNRDGLASREGIPSFGVRNGSPSQRRFLQVHQLILRLQGRDGQGPARGAKRKAILDQLKSDPLTMTHYPEIADEIEAAERSKIKKLLRQESRLKFGPYSTRVGLGSSYEPRPEVLALGLPELEHMPGLSNFKFEPADLWLFPAIDLPTLLKEMSKRGVEVSEFYMLWTRDDPGIYTYVNVDIRDGFRSGLNLQSLDDRYPGTRAALIVRSPNGRRRFVCPRNGKACDTLYLRDGVLGSREALGLTYPNYRKESKLKVRTLVQEFQVATQWEQIKKQAEIAEREEVDRMNLEIEIWTQLARRALGGHLPSMKKYLDMNGWGHEREEFSYPEISDYLPDWAKRQ